MLCISSKMSWIESKSVEIFVFQKISLHFHCTLATLEPQSYVMIEQFRRENIPLLSGIFVAWNRILYIALV